VDWRSYGDLALMVAAGTAGLFCLLYAATAPWYRTALGRSLFSTLLTLSVAIGYFTWAVNRRGQPLPDNFYPMRAGLFTLLAFSLASSTFFLTRAQLRGRPKRRYQDELEDAR
jgi:hypothetical protein